MPPPLSPARSTTASNVFDAMEGCRSAVGEESFLRRESGRLLRAARRGGDAVEAVVAQRAGEGAAQGGVAPLQAAVDAAVAEVGWLRAAVAEGGGERGG